MSETTMNICICSDCGIAFSPSDLTQVIYHQKHKPTKELGVEGQPVCDTEKKEDADSLRSFCQTILHGDAAHKQWLLNACEAFIQGGETPAPPPLSQQAAAERAVIEAAVAYINMPNDIEDENPCGCGDITMLWDAVKALQKAEEGQG